MSTHILRAAALAAALLPAAWPSPHRCPSTQALDLAVQRSEAARVGARRRR